MIYLPTFTFPFYTRCECCERTAEVDSHPILASVSKAVPDDGINSKRHQHKYAGTAGKESVNNSKVRRQPNKCEVPEMNV